MAIMSRDLSNLFCVRNGLKRLAADGTSVWFVDAPPYRRRLNNLIRIPAFITGLLLLCFSAPLAARGGAPDPDISSILAEMSGREHRFNPMQLHGLGIDGLEALLDVLLPETAGPKSLQVPQAAVAQLIERLGSDNSQARESAMKELLRIGPAAKPWVDAAVGSGDAEVAWRARCVIQGWELHNREDKSMYLPAFAAYASGIHDDRRLRELSKRTIMALQTFDLEGGRYAILEVCISVLVATGKDEYVDPLKPLLKHSDLRVAVLVAGTVGEAAASMRTNQFFPDLLLEALRSDRDEIVGVAIEHVANCKDAARNERVEKLLTDIFQGDNEHLKFQSCSPLLRTFHNAAARDFLLEQAQGTDLNRRSMALASLCNNHQTPEPADEKTFEILSKLLKSADSQTRFMAAGAMATFAGENVVKTLIDMLGDSNGMIPSDLSGRLLEQPDKAMLQRMLLDASKNHVSDKVRKRATAMLQELDARD
jgi:hypothetical protein